jgi:hypothetical protein
MPRHGLFDGCPRTAEIRPVNRGVIEARLNADIGAVMSNPVLSRSAPEQLLVKGQQYRGPTYAQVLRRHSAPTAVVSLRVVTE